MLPSPQQGQYSDLNVLVAGSNRKCMIYAVYADGEEEIYQSSGTPKVDELGFPYITDAASTNPDVIPVTGYQMTRRWDTAGSPSYSYIRTGTATVWTLEDPLALDPTRTLTGIRLAIYDQDTYMDREAVILAVSANERPPIPEPGALALLGLGGLGLISRRKRR